MSLYLNLPNLVVFSFQCVRDYDFIINFIIDCNGFNCTQVDCITVSTTPVKAVIDDHIQRLFDALLNSLRRSITKDVGTIETFLNDAMETLSNRPQTVEEIGQANAKHSEFGKAKKEVYSSLASFILSRKIKSLLYRG